MSATTHRQRRQRALASFLQDPWGRDGKHCDFYGDPRKAPKRWKRLWSRQVQYVQKWRPVSRRLQLLSAAQAGKGVQ